MHDVGELKEEVLLLRKENKELRADQAHWELEHCPACKNVADLQEALDENAKLIVKLNAEHIVRQNAEAENAKLRELVRDAWGNGHPDRSCGDCDIRDECHNDIERLRKDGMLRFSRCLFELRIEDRMRELGAEVD